MFQGSLVWSELQQDDTRLLYRYITNTLLPNSLRSSSSAFGAGPAGTPGSAIAPSPFSGHQGRFLAGGPDKETLRKAPEPGADLPEFRTPRVNLQGEYGGEHRLLVYHAVGSTLCMLVPAIREPTHEFYRGLDALVGPHLTNMSADLMDVFGANASSGSGSQVLW